MPRLIAMAMAMVHGPGTMGPAPLGPDPALVHGPKAGEMALAHWPIGPMGPGPIGPMGPGPCRLSVKYLI